MYIMCSIGPKVSDPKSISELHKAGMNVVRYNFSHIDYDRTKQLINFIKNNYPDIKIFQDLQGNKLRVGEEFDDQVMVRRGDRVIFCSQETYPVLKRTVLNKTIVPIAFKGDFWSLNSTKYMFMKDATMKFKVVRKASRDSIYRMIETRVELGGVIRSGKGINAPGMNRNGMGLTQKDKEDILWGLENHVDMICLSYVCSEDNILELKKFIDENNKWDSSPEIWAKIESKEGIENIQSIIKNVDGIMLGRGDLFAEVDPVLIPSIQDKLMGLMKKNGKELIIATYVLSSMKSSQTPLLSELDDIYYCIRKKVSGFMLSTEVSVGRYPIHTVKMLKRMIDRYGKKE